MELLKELKEVILLCMAHILFEVGLHVVGLLCGSRGVGAKSIAIRYKGDIVILYCMFILYKLI